jgi:hypothetical protein
VRFTACAQQRQLGAAGLPAVMYRQGRPSTPLLGLCEVPNAARRFAEGASAEMTRPVSKVHGAFIPACSRSRNATTVGDRSGRRRSSTLASEAVTALNTRW